LLDDAEDRIVEGSYTDAIELLNQAFNFEMWRRLYGQQILLNLGYANVKIGNMVMAREHILDLDQFFGDDQLDPEEKARLSEVYRCLDIHDMNEMEKYDSYRVNNIVGLDSPELMQADMPTQNSIDEEVKAYN
jgi:hypothetical protein